CENGFLGDDEFLDISNPNQTTVNEFWRSRADAQAAVIATYSALQSPNVMGGQGMMYRACLSGDEGYPRAFNEADVRDQLYTFNYNSNTAFVNNLWKEVYTGVFRANQVIKNVPNITGLEEEDMTTFVAEAKFLRGLFYFWLMNFYNEGNIPLVTEVATSPDDIYTELSDKSVVLAQILEDLEAAQAGLPRTWNEVNKGRATWGAATALLGKVHLYEENWVEAAAYFKQVINSGLYTLVESPFDNFNIAGEHNSESIFEVGFSAEAKPGANVTQTFLFDTPSGSEGTYRARLFNIGGSMAGWHSFILGGFLGEALILDTLDTSNPMNEGRTYSLRSEASIGFQFDGLPFYTVTAEDGRHNNSTSGLVAKKYQNWTLPQEDIVTNASSINERLIRLADVYLMYAEAIVERDGAVSQEAVDYLNLVRDRAGVARKIGPSDDPDNPSFASKESFINYLVWLERPRELCIEGFGIRFLDLRRKGKFAESVARLSDSPGTYKQPSWKSVNDATGLNPVPREYGFKSMSARRFNAYNPGEVFHHWLPLPSEELLANLLL
ncbi:MAG: RagB/SusD family nutrient uptake outer membrane protein, partial [Bacteroidota bacterium]